MGKSEGEAHKVTFTLDFSDILALKGLKRLYSALVVLFKFRSSNFIL